MHVPAIVWLGVALLAARLVLRPVLALVHGKQIGAQVLARQPDAIHLVPAARSAALKPDVLEAGAQVLVQEGFTDAGWFTVPEIPDVTLRMLANEAEGLHATLYEHRRAGHWTEIGARYPDGTRTSWTSMRATGLGSLPNVTVTHLEGATPGAVLRAARAGREHAALTPLVVNAAQAPRVFEAGYADLVAARKAQGISRAEVAAVAARPSRVKGKRVA